MTKVVPAQKEHFDAIYAIEKDSFSQPWGKDDLWRDIFDHPISIYLVAVENGTVVGYGGMWHIVTEGHITNIAVHRDYRKRGVGGLLVEGLLRVAEEKEMIGVTLEVRTGNKAAFALYEHYGFAREGIRKGYYTDTKEDAVIMWRYM